MLVLSRKPDQAIEIQGPLKAGESIRIVLVDIRGDKARIGIDAPPAVPVHREEVARAIARGGDALKPGMRPRPAKRRRRTDGRKLSRMLTLEGT